MCMGGWRRELRGCGKLDKEAFLYTYVLCVCVCGQNKSLIFNEEKSTPKRCVGGGLAFVDFGFFGFFDQIIALYYYGGSGFLKKQ